MTSLALACKLGTAAAISQLPARVKHILRKYGATLLMPGPSGVLQYGFQPNNYRESTGQTLAAVDQQVGLVVDAANGNLGDETVFNGNFAAGNSGWSTASGFSFTSGALTITANGGATTNNLGAPATAGALYYCEVVVSSFVSGQARLNIGGVNGVPLNAVGEFRFFITANTNANPMIYCTSSGSSLVISRVSAKAVSGIHALQATSGYQPYLRYAPILGADLLADWDFLSAAAWQANGGASLSVAEGIGTTTFSAGSNYPTVLQYGTTEVGKTYEVEIRAKKTTTDNVRFLVGATSVNITDSYQTYRLNYQAVAASTLCRVQVAASSASAGSFEIDYFRVREIIGYDSRIQSWQFDGTDDRLSLSSVPFQMADDHFVVIGVEVGTVGATRHIFNASGLETQRLCNIAISNTGYPTVLWRDDAGTLVSVSSTTQVSAGAEITISAKKSGNTKSLRLNGVTAAPDNTTALGVTTVASGNGMVGSYLNTGSGYFNSHIHGVIFGKGAISDSELLTLEKFAAKLQGRSL